MSHEEINNSERQRYEKGSVLNTDNVFEVMRIVTVQRVCGKSPKNKDCNILAQNLCPKFEKVQVENGFLRHPLYAQGARKVKQATNLSS